VKRHSWSFAALAITVLLLAGAAQPAAAAQTAPLSPKAQNERGSAIGTPLPVGKVEAAPIAPPPYSDSEKAALAKLEAATNALGEMRAALSEEINRTGILASWLTALALLQLFVLALQLWLLRRVRQRAQAPPQAAAAAEAAPGEAA